MKRFISLLLAAALTLPLAVTIAAADDVTYPVGSISDDGYLLAEDSSFVDLNEVAERIPFGETVYYPLLNDGASGALKEAQALLTAAKATLAEYNQAISSYNTALNAAKAAESAANAPIVAALNALKTAKANLADAEEELEDLEDDRDDVEDDLNTVLGQISVAENTTIPALEAARALLDDGRYNATQTAQATAFKTAKAAFDAAYALLSDPDKLTANSDLAAYIADPAANSGKDNWIKALGDAIIAIPTATDVSTAQGIANPILAWIDDLADAIQAENDAKEALGDPGDAKSIGPGSSLYAKRNYYQDGLDNYNNTLIPSKNTEISGLEGIVTTCKNATALSSLTITDSTNLDTLIAQYSSSTVDPTSIAGYAAFVTATANLATVQSSITTLENEIAMLQANPSSYPFVHEAAAVKSVKIKSSWSEGKNYIESISVVRKRFVSDIYSYTGAQRYIYFLAVETRVRDSAASTKIVDVSGTVSLRKTGSYGFDYEDVYVDIELELGFKQAEESNLIPIKPALFTPEEDFDLDSEEEFEFEADGYSFFIVDTRNQKKLVLGMNTDYNDDVGDLYPRASLEFFNGNGGTFNKLGYLYLAADRDSYIYRINDNGDLEEIDAKYDRSEEAYMIRTRTLGSYVVSDTKLNVIKHQDDTEIEAEYDPTTGETHNPQNPGMGGYPWEYGYDYDAADYEDIFGAATNTVTSKSSNDASKAQATPDNSAEPTPTGLGNTGNTVKIAPGSGLTKAPIVQSLESTADRLMSEDMPMGGMWLVYLLIAIIMICTVGITFVIIKTVQMKN